MLVLGDKRCTRHIFNWLVGCRIPCVLGPLAESELITRTAVLCATQDVTKDYLTKHYSDVPVVWCELTVDDFAGVKQTSSTTTGKLDSVALELMEYKYNVPRFDKDDLLANHPTVVTLVAVLPLRASDYGCTCVTQIGFGANIC